MNKYISISDCEICRIIEQKIHIDLQREQKIPSWVEDLSTIYKIKENAQKVLNEIERLQIDKNIEFLREVIKDSEKKLAGKSYRKKKK